MKKGWLRKLLRISGVIFLVLLVAILVLAYRFITPKTDEQILKDFEGEKHQPFIEQISFRGRTVRMIRMKHEIDPNLPTLVFIHGSPGSTMDFKRYLKDDRLNACSNIIAYDRPGYSDRDTGEILPSVESEVELLEEILKGTDIGRTTVVGYSYGGTVALASPMNFHKKVALAAAVNGELEPMFWAMKLYKWNLTRPMVPKVLQAASEEKLRHIVELKGDEERWRRSESDVVSVHGKEDFIVPYQNSIYLKNLLGQRFKLVTLEKGDHALIWTNFELIRDLLLQSFD